MMRLALSALMFGIAGVLAIGAAEQYVAAVCFLIAASCFGYISGYNSSFVQTKPLTTLHSCIGFYLSKS